MAALLPLAAAGCGHDGGSKTETVASAVPGTSASVNAGAAPSASWIDRADVVTESPDGTPVVKSVPQGGHVRALTAVGNGEWDGTDYTASAAAINALTCNTLVGYPTTADPDRALELRPELAAAMPDVSADGLTYRFRVRNDVRYSDGRAVTSDDVKATFLRMLDPAAALPPLELIFWDAIAGVPEYRGGLATDIDGIDAIGDQVTFTLTEPDGAFLYELAMSMACVVPADAPHQSTRRPPPMTGPYVVTRYDRRSLTLKRNRWWDHNVDAGLPADPDTFNVDGFDVTLAVAPDRQVQLLRSGEADVSLDASCCGRDVAIELARDPNTRRRLHADPSTTLAWASFDVTAKPFDDALVRQAANFAVDREAVAALIAGPLGATPLSSILPDSHAPAGVDNRPYPTTPDLARARALLRKAGLRTPVRAGHIYCQDRPPFRAIAAQIARDLQAIGLVLDLRPLGRDAYFSVVSDPARHDDALALAGWAPDYPDGATLLEPYLTSAAADVGDNQGGFRDAAFDAALARAIRLRGPARRLTMWRLSYDLAVEQAPWMPLYRENALNLVSPRYGGYGYHQTKTVELGLAYLRR